MHSNHRKTKKEFTREIAITDGVDAVLTHTRKAEVVCDLFAIKYNRRSGKRAGPKREHIGAGQAIPKPIRVALE